MTGSFYSALFLGRKKDKVPEKAATIPVRGSFSWRMELYPSIKASTNIPKSASVSMSVLAIVLIIVSV